MLDVLRKINYICTQIANMSKYIRFYTLRNVL